MLLGMVQAPRRVEPQDDPVARAGDGEAGGRRQGQAVEDEAVGELDPLKGMPPIVPRSQGWPPPSG